MRRTLSRRTILALGCLWAAALWAQEAGAAGEKCFLWEARSATNAVYLLGSIHLARPDLYPLDRRIEEAFEASPVLVVEADITRPETMIETSLLIREKGMYPQGESLDDHLSRETLQRLETHLESLGLGMEPFRAFQPWILASTLTTMELFKKGFSPQYGIDMYFLNKALGRKQIIELEGVQAQIAMLAGFPDDLQESFLLASLEEVDALEEKVDAILSAWKDGNAAAMQDTFREAMEKDPRFLLLSQKLFDERNLDMAEKIEGYLRSDRSHFVVVGSGHLLGEKGILALLHAREYTVEQLEKGSGEGPEDSEAAEVVEEALPETARAQNPSATPPQRFPQ
ncbi:MAG: TraB/GumN family protein [Planctomycetota bacterium]